MKTEKDTNIAEILDESDNIITDSKLIAHILNNYFVNVRFDVANNINLDNSKPRNWN